MFQTTNDLDELDKKRRTEFHNYELEKEHERRGHLKGLDENERKQEEQKYEEMQKKHKDHPQMHHPVSRHTSPEPSLIKLTCFMWSTIFVPVQWAHLTIFVPVQWARLTIFVPVQGAHLT